MNRTERVFQHGKAFFTQAGRVLGGCGVRAGDVGAVWQRSVRVWQTLVELCRVERIETTGLIDAASAAALWGESCRISWVQAGRLSGETFLTLSMDRELRAASCEVIRAELASILDRRDIEWACDILVDAGPARPTTLISKALIDSQRLDQIGVVGVVSQAEAALREGKSLRHVLDVWQRQQEYHYWPSRIKTDFYFDASRRLATSRVEHMRQVFELLDRELDLNDLSSLVGGEETIVSRTNQS